MTVEIISRSISTKVWERAGIELANPESAVRLASIARHVTDCATRPSNMLFCVKSMFKPNINTFGQTMRHEFPLRATNRF